MQGLIGRKIGMTRVFDKESGRPIPVTVIESRENVVYQVKTAENDGYRSVQLGFDPVAEERVSKAVAGHCKKFGSGPTRYIREFKLDDENESVESGSTVGMEIFEGTAYVDVIVISKGRGFSGTIKRYNFRRGRETHGNTNHRERGSIGASAYPARVLPGLTMAGQYGNKRVTAVGLEVVRIDTEAGLLLVKGAVPGRNRGIVVVRKNRMKKGSGG